MEWLQAVAALLVALVAVARLLMDWHKKRQSEEKKER